MDRGASLALPVRCCLKITSLLLAPDIAISARHYVRAIPAERAYAWAGYTQTVRSVSRCFSLRNIYGALMGQLAVNGASHMVPGQTCNWSSASRMQPGSSYMVPCRRPCKHRLLLIMQQAENPDLYCEWHAEPICWAVTCQILSVCCQIPQAARKAI